MNFVSTLPGAVGWFRLIQQFAQPVTAVPGTRLGGETLLTFATSTGQVVAGNDADGNVVAELRRLSGLTFDQLAKVFEVTRRCVHLWMSGQRMQPAKQERVQRVLATLRRIDRGTSDLTRAALLADGAKGFDLLVAGELAEVEELLGPGTRKRRPTPPRVASEVLAQRRPSPPADLVQAREDTPHPAIHSKRIKSMRATKLRRGES